MYSHADTWFQPDGILSALIEDLDEDGDWRCWFSQLKIRQRSSMRDVRRTPMRSPRVMGTVYEIADGEVQAADTALIREYNEKDWKIFTFTSPQADDFFGTLLEVDVERSICLSGMRLQRLLQTV